MLISDNVFNQTSGERRESDSVWKKQVRVRVGTEEKRKGRKENLKDKWKH